MNIRLKTFEDFKSLNEAITKTSDDFFNKVCKEIDGKYFPDVKYYGDNKNTTDIHRTVELFNNGVLSYAKLIQRLAKSCNDSNENIHNIIKKYIVDFGGYEYKAD